MTTGPIRRFTAQQMKIAKAIARNLSYAEIGAELHISKHTVQAHVRQMGLLLDEPHDLPPRWRILVWVKASELAEKLANRTGSSAAD